MPGMTTQDWWLRERQKPLLFVKGDITHRAVGRRTTDDDGQHSLLVLMDALTDPLPARLLAADRVIIASRAAMVAGDLGISASELEAEVIRRRDLFR